MTATQPAPQTLPRTGKALGYLILAFGAFCTCLIAYDLWANVQAGGDPWKQADWLINDLNQPLRRGFLGSVLINVSDLFGLSPLTPVYLVQGACLLILMGILLLVLSRLQTPAALTLIAFSPAFVFVFWAADPAGSLRKELLGYTAIALLLLVPLYPQVRRSLTVASMFIYALACVAHEVNVLLAPAYGLVFLLCLRPGWPGAALFAAIVAAVGGGTILYSMAHTGVADHTTICSPLTARGLDPDFCIGAIKWMEWDTSFGRDLVGQMFLSKRNLGLFGISYLLVALPFVYLITRTNRPLTLLAAAVLLIIPVLPLYPIAVDWGRWMNLHVMSFVFVLFAEMLTGSVRIARPVSPLILAAAILIGLLWEQQHADIPQIGGLIAELATSD